MEDWRIYALAFFPELRISLLDVDESYYDVFFYMHRVLLGLYQAEDIHALDRMFAFAEWCLNYPDTDMVNGILTAFYEHLFDHREYWEHAIRYLKPFVIERCCHLWLDRLKGDQGEKLHHLLGLK